MKRLLSTEKKPSWPHPHKSLDFLFVCKYKLNSHKWIVLCTICAQELRINSYDLTKNFDCRYFIQVNAMKWIAIFPCQVATSMSIDLCINRIEWFHLVSHHWKENHSYRHWIMEHCVFVLCVQPDHSAYLNHFNCKLFWNVIDLLFQRWIWFNLAPIKLFNCFDLLLGCSTTHLLRTTNWWKWLYKWIYATIYIDINGKLSFNSVKKRRCNWIEIVYYVSCYSNLFENELRMLLNGFNNFIEFFFQNWLLQ